MDADYLKETVGDSLAAALTSLALKQPKDPVDFVGQYLVKYADYLDAKVTKADVVKGLEEKQAQLDEEAARLQEKSNAHAAINKHWQQTEEAKIASLQQTTETEVIYSTVLESLKEAAHATGAYIGKKIELADVSPYIKYIASDKVSAWMVGKVLKGGGESEEEGNQAEGVTFRVWEEVPTEPPAEGEEEAEDAEPKPSAFPEYIHIENVLREPGVKFFGVPKLGAYLALPVTYPSGLHDDGIADAPPVEEAQEAPADREEGTAATEEGGEEEGGDATSAPAEIANAFKPTPPGPRFVKVNKAIHLVLGLDCIGQSRSFTSAQIEAAVKWAKVLANALEAADTTLWNEEVARLEEITKEEESSRSVTVLKVKAQLDDLVRETEGMEDGADKTLKEKELAFITAKTALLGSKSYLTKLSTLLIKPKGLNFVRLAQTVVTLLGLPSDDLLTWEGLRAQLGEAFWNRLNEVSPDVNSLILHTKEDVEGLRGMLEGILEEEVEGACLESYLFLKYANALLDLTDAIWEKKAADVAAAEAAAQEEVQAED